MEPRRTASVKSDLGAANLPRGTDAVVVTVAGGVDGSAFAGDGRDGI